MLSYPKEKDKSHKINMKEYKNCKEVPLFMQWDKRWGYMEYGSEDGKIKVNDPNSKANSEKLWNYDDIYSQIKNLWVLR